jgi:NAD(P)-dependent dehydrogenase (short-subunit alcohol dehydrogenase family)
MSEFADRRVLVTGGTSGIGRSIAETFAGEGAHVVISGRNIERGAEVVDRILVAGGRATFVEVELSEGWRAVERLAREAVAAAGPIDILVNNAAIMPGAQSLLEATETQIQNVLMVNVTVPFLLTAALVPTMIEQGRGAIVNIGSISGARGTPVGAVYGASKAALHSLTMSWAAELAAKGVRVNAVVPGPTITDSNTRMHEHFRKLSADYPAGQAGTAADVADAVMFLAGDRARHIHGIRLPVDGGALTR